jgi:hypothetical protein
MLEIPEFVAIVRVILEEVQKTPKDDEGTSCGIFLLLT